MDDGVHIQAKREMRIACVALLATGLGVFIVDVHDTEVHSISSSKYTEGAWCWVPAACVAAGVMSFISLFEDISSRDWFFTTHR